MAEFQELLGHVRSLKKLAGQKRFVIAVIPVERDARLTYDRRVIGQMSQLATNSEGRTIFLATPTYDGWVHSDTAMGWQYAIQTGLDVERVLLKSKPGSLLASNCNELWCIALNNREEHGIKWYAQLHADVGPPPRWLDILVQEANKYGADMMAASIPLKDQFGYTSTAIANTEGGYSQFGRLTQSQVNHPDFPETFDINMAADALDRLPGDLRVANVPRVQLLANTGCMVVRCDKLWATEVCFQQIDGIEVRNGMWQTCGISEDWFFSRRVAQCGGKVMVTKKLNCIHHGTAKFESGKTWGKSSDCDYGHLQDKKGSAA